MARLVDDWIDKYLVYSSNTEPPAMFHLWTAISVISSVLQRKCYFPWGTLTFYPNMYVVLVGPPAARKGTAMNIGKKILDDMKEK